MTIIQAKGKPHGYSCVRCGTPSPEPYCPTHRPKNFDRTQAFWGGQGATTAQRRQRQRILSRDSNTCNYCGKPATQVDHITPQSRGGGDQDWNLVACCAECNLKKGDR